MTKPMRVMAALALCLGTTGAWGLPALAVKAPDELYVQAEKEAKAADKRLNQAYKKLMAILDPQAQKKLVAAELAWIKFRDSEADFAVAKVAGVYEGPTVRQRALAGLSLERAKQLEGTIEFLENY